MGDEDNGDTGVPVDLSKQLGQLPSIGFIQSARGLICKQQHGLINQGSNDRDALTFTARKLRWTLVLVFGETDLFEKKLGPLRGFISPRFVSINQSWNQNILQSRELRQQVVHLENEPYFLGSHRGQFLLTHASNGLSEKRDFACGGLIQGAEHVEQRAFPAAAAADDRDSFSFLNREIHATQNLLGAACVDAEKFGDLRKLGNHDQCAKAGSRCLLVATTD